MSNSLEKNLTQSTYQQIHAYNYKLACDLHKFARLLRRSLRDVEWASGFSWGHITYYNLTASNRPWPDQTATSSSSLIFDFLYLYLYNYWMRRTFLRTSSPTSSGPLAPRRLVFVNEHLTLHFVEFLLLNGVSIVISPGSKTWNHDQRRDWT